MEKIQTFNLVKKIFARMSYVRDDETVIDITLIKNLLAETRQRMNVARDRAMRKDLPMKKVLKKQTKILKEFSLINSNAVMNAIIDGPGE